MEDEGMLEISLIPIQVWERESTGERGYSVLCPCGWESAICHSVHEAVALYQEHLERKADLN